MSGRQKTNRQGKSNQVSGVREAKRGRRSMLEEMARDGSSGWPPPSCRKDSSTSAAPSPSSILFLAGFIPCQNSYKVDDEYGTCADSSIRRWISTHRGNGSVIPP